MSSASSSTRNWCPTSRRICHDEVGRVQRDAVAADAGTRIEGHEPERLRRGGVDDLPHVDAHLVAEHGHLVRPARCSRGGTCSPAASRARPPGRSYTAHHLVHELLVEQRREARGLRVHAPDDPRHVPERVLRVAGVDPLRRIGQQEVAPGMQTRGLEASAATSCSVVPGYVVDSSTTSAARRQACRRRRLARAAR